MGIEIIETLKKKLNLTSKELSDISGVPLGTLNKILNGTTKDPKLETLKALARALNCTLDDFDDDEFKSSKLKVLTDNFNKLNETGKDEAVKRVCELTEINKYTELKKTNIKELHSNDKSYLMPIAAHDDDLTDEEKEEMNRRIEEILKKRNRK